MPILSECMTPVIYNEGKEEVIEADELEIKNCSWYDYIAQEGNTENGGTSKWANAKTKDGSIWVWVPRYAYKITYNNEEDKSAGGKIDVIFLKGTSNKDKNEEDVTKKGYIVHPAFKNGTRNNYSNGEWNKELPGIWVSKFEAGYAGLKNTAGENVQAIDTSMVYKTVGNNVYGEVIENETKIKYPIYIGRTYSYNNLDVGEMFKLSKELTKEGNPYGFDSKNIDSHMMKNSEWGAVAYLAHSQYGRNGTKITINNVCNEKIVGASAITGYAADEINQAENIINEEIIGDELNNSYAWYTKKGTLASTTGNMYGIYDMVGGTIEYVAGYLENISENFMIYTENFGNIKTGNKYGQVGWKYANGKLVKTGRGGTTEKVKIVLSTVISSEDFRYTYKNKAICGIKSVGLGESVATGYSRVVESPEFSIIPPFGDGNTYEVKIKQYDPMVITLIVTTGVVIFLITKKKK